MNITTNEYKNCFNSEYRFYNKMEKILKQFIIRCRKNSMKTCEIIDLINKHYVFTDNEIIDIVNIVCRESGIEFNDLVNIINKKYKINITSLNYFFDVLKLSHKPSDVLIFPLNCLINYTDTLEFFHKFSSSEQKIRRKIFFADFLYQTMLDNERFI